MRRIPIAVERALELIPVSSQVLPVKGNFRTIVLPGGSASRGGPTPCHLAQRCNSALEETIEVAFKTLLLRYLPVATRAFARRTPIRHHTSAVDLAVILMAEAARHVLMSSGERKRACLVVVEQRGGPVNRVVTGRAIDQR